MSSEITRSLRALGEFERAFDELFEDMLIGRWRMPRRRSVEHLMRDRGLYYEVTLSTGDVDPGRIDVEATEHQLRVRVPTAAGGIEGSFDFPHPVDRARVKARWARGVLRIVLPKANGRKIEIE